METRITTTTPPASSPAIEENKRKEQAARDVAYNIVGPHVYRMGGISTNPVRFFVIGCHGNGGDSQKATAALMNKIAQDLKKSGEPTPSFILFLGDNIYDYGVSSPFDPAFNECFHNIYFDLNLPGIKLPCWMLLGNHDFNMHSKAWMGKFGKGEVVAINQVGHTYIDNTVEAIEKKAAMFTNEVLTPDMLPPWNMPYFFYSLIAGDTQIFCLDSNNFLADYLDLLNGQVDSEGRNIHTKHMNQAAWFFKENAAAKAAGRQTFIAQHHPLFVSGKRAFPEGYDWKHYINENQLNDLNSKLKARLPGFSETKSYNGLLAAVFQAENVDPDLVFAAHEHFQSYYNNMEANDDHPILRQLTSGGGGGDLQKRLSYLGHPYVSFFQKHNGFTMVTCDPAYPNTYTLDIYTTEGLHLRFCEDSQHPVMNQNDDPQVEMLRKSVMDACNSYFYLLKNAEIQHSAMEKNAKSNESGGLFASAFRMFSDTFSSIYHTASTLLDHLYPNSNSEIENSTVQDIQAYFSQLDLGDYKTVLTELFKLTRQLPYRTSGNDYNFYSMLQRHIKIQSHQDLHTLFANAGLQDTVTSEYQAALPMKA